MVLESELRSGKSGPGKSGSGKSGSGEPVARDGRSRDAQDRKDHYALLGLEPSPCIDTELLEIRYLKASRKVHPDLNRDCDEAELIEASSRLNEAYRTLSDPWKRLPYLAELYSPCILEETKNMAPCFLMEAMELGEMVEESHAHLEMGEKLENDLRERLESLRLKIEELLQDPTQASEAARLCHQARYVQRALSNLRRRDIQGS